MRFRGNPASKNVRFRGEAPWKNVQRGENSVELCDLIASIDIKEYISQYVDLEQRGEEFWGVSPFTYPPECTPSFSVRPATGQFYDFSSAIGGNVFTFVRKYHKVDPQRAVEILKKYAGVSESVEGGAEISPRLVATQICKRFSVAKSPKKVMLAADLPDDVMTRYENAPDKMEVWRREGISDETMRFFGVRYDSFTNRLVYPIRDSDGKIVNIGGRTLDPDFKAKKLRKYTYFYKWGGRLGLIYGLYENREAIQTKKEVILFEGMKSVMLAREFGFQNCGAILTSHLNPEQMAILARLGYRCVFALDKEIDVREDHNIEKLRRYVKVYYISDFKNRLGEKDAPVDRGKDVFEALYDERKRWW